MTNRQWKLVFGAVLIAVGSIFLLLDFLSVAYLLGTVGAVLVSWNLSEI